MESGGIQSEIALLKSDIERLNEELKTATSEKIQSAQYGLVLLVRDNRSLSELVL